jgi:hypothetical protein
MNTLLRQQTNRAVSRLLAGLVWTGVVATAFDAAADSHALEGVDRRQQRGAGAARQAERSRGEENLRARLPQADVSHHEITGGPKWISTRDGFLSGKNGEGRGIPAAARRAQAADDRHAAVKAFVNEHAALFGHDARMLDNSPVSREFTGKHNGLRTVTWQQALEGIPVFDGTLTSHTTRDGELMAVSGQMLPDAAGARGNGNGAAPANAISAARAITAAGADLGDSINEAAVRAGSEAAGAHRNQKFFAPGAAGEIDARLVWLPLSGDSMRLCWQIYIQSRAQKAMYRVFVDAADATVWKRDCLTDHISPASYRVYTSESPTPRLPGNATPGIAGQPPTVARSLVTLSALDTTASPNGWINDGVNETTGNNVDAHLDLDDDELPDLPRPQGSPNRVFDFPMNTALAPSAYREASVVNLFYWCNWMHDKLYALGFDEAAGNFQVNNFGRGGLGNDPVLADAQDGGGVNNANMATPGDGVSPRMQMYIWDGTDPDRDSSFDATVILHEYTHGLSNRRVGTGIGLSGQQPRGMGEGWSDFYGLALLTTNVAGNFPVASYLLTGDNYYYGLRHYPYSTNLSVNPLTFKDIDPNQASAHSGVPRSGSWGAPEEHSVGEVWCAMLWEVRASLINKLGPAVGSPYALQLVTDGMNLSPNNPTFTQARDGILLADQALGGTNQTEIMRAFGKRGLGQYAYAPAYTTTVGLVEEFDVASGLSVTPVAPVKVNGVYGGPFYFASTAYTVLNASNTTLSWVGFADAPLQMSPASGTLASGANQQVTVTLNAAQATTMQTSSRDVIFSNTVTHTVRTRRFDFTLSEPLDLSFNLEVIEGPKGGPFNDSGYPIRMTNLSATAMSWRANVPWPFTMTQSSGTLAAFAVTALNFGVLPEAELLDPGRYDASAQVTNLVTGRVFHIDLLLIVGDTEFGVAEYTDEAPALFNVPNKTINFIPGASTFGYGYGICVDNASGFPTDPTGSAQMPYLQWGYLEKTNVLLANGQQVTIAGHTTNSVWVWADGRVTLTASGNDPYTPLNTHFGNPGVSGFFWGYYYEDKTLAAGGGIGWKQLADRFVVTWQKMITQVNYAYVSNNFQVELFFDGRIRITLLNILPGSEGIVGLSDGQGKPYPFSGTDFSTRPTCAALLPNLGLAFTGTPVEGAGPLAGAGTVFLPAPVASNVVVTLTSGDATQVSVPATVTIPAGATSAVFSVTAVNDALLDGSQTRSVTASHFLYETAVGYVTVHDNESTQLHLTPPVPVAEGGYYQSGTVSMPAPLPVNVVVTLTSTPPGLIQFILPFAYIPAGQTSALFSVVAPDNSRIEGAVSASVIAQVVNWQSGTTTVQVLDNENTNLTVVVPALLIEGSGTLSNTAQVRISGTLPTNLPVTVTSSMPTRAAVASPVVIPAGQTNAFFSVTLPDNVVLDPILDIVTFTASAFRFNSGTASAYIYDNDGPPPLFNPRPPHLSDNISVHTDLSWDAIEGNVISNGTFEVGSLKGWTPENTGASSFMINNGIFNPSSPDGATAPHTGSFSAISQQLGNGRCSIWQDVTIPLGATTAQLTWNHRVRNHAGQFVPGQQEFRVELRSPTNNTLLATLFATAPGGTLLGNWTTQSVSLASFRGQNVRLVFAQDNLLGYLNVHLDNIALNIGSVGPTSFDVYFGTNPYPDAEDFLGTTTNNFWPLPQLAGGTDYYWRIESKRAGQTNAGPVWLFSTAGQTATSNFFGFNSSWRYLANGSNQGTNWWALNFSDTTWGTGSGILGFGGKQNTTIGSANGVVTYYFRKKFVVTNATQFVSLRTRHLRDDGLIAYLNGNQILADNMGRGPWVYTNQAAVIISGTDETATYTNSIDPALLVEGTNILAIEVHQKHPALGNSTDLYFDLALDGVRNTGNEPPAVAISSPANGLLFSANGGNLSVTAAVTDDNFAGGIVRFFANGVLIGADSTSPYTIQWSAPPAGQHQLTVVARDSGGLMATSSPIAVVAQPTNGQVFTLIPRGANWSYRDKGDNLGTNWFNQSINYAAWSNGPAQLGYGDNDEATRLSHGAVSNANYITTYFRRQFTNNMNISALHLNVLRDDGVVVRLNGGEAARQNLPAGNLAYNIPAVTNVPTTDEHFWYATSISTSLVVAGVNAVQAEVHEYSTSSLDLSFDLELTAVGNSIPTVALTAPANNTVHTRPTNLLVSASAGDLFGQVSRVEFFANGASIGIASNAPHQIIWTNPPLGTLKLSAVVTDTAGATGLSGTNSINMFGHLSIALRQQGGQWQVTWPSAAGTFAVQTSSNLGPSAFWATIPIAPVQTNGLMVVPVSTNVPQRFFRLLAF